VVPGLLGAVAVVSKQLMLEDSHGREWPRVSTCRSQSKMPALYSSYRHTQTSCSSHPTTVTQGVPIRGVLSGDGGSRVGANSKTEANGDREHFQIKSRLKIAWVFTGQLVVHSAVPPKGGHPLSCRAILLDKLLSLNTVHNWNPHDIARGRDVCAGGRPQGQAPQTVQLLLVTISYPSNIAKPKGNGGPTAGRGRSY